MHVPLERRNSNSYTSSERSSAITHQMGLAHQPNLPAISKEMVKIHPWSLLLRRNYSESYSKQTGHSPLCYEITTILNV